MDVERQTVAVVMGVSGVGKTTVAAELARRTGWVSLEGDDLHTEASRRRMAAGRPLTDDDRWPWLRRIADWIGEQESAGRSGVVTCSALRRSYRDLLRAGHPCVWFVHLVAGRPVLADRLRRRRGHYMPAALLTSQLDTLEELQPDEPGIAVPADRDTAVVVDQVLGALRSRPALPGWPG
ncbi:gluconokinase [Pseudonocardia hispaniensis]|uniref:Gluconokinase n=1 Tax=Pseudonocardia hispaniensis TaxID=904933 RepID=A0ABW1J0F7_9PSEU